MPIARSLRGRVLVWVGIALIALFAVTIFILDLAFRQTMDRSREELLQSQLLGLIALADADEYGNLRLPSDVINPQFGVADSGLYGVVWAADGATVWQSSSLVGRDFPHVAAPEAGQSQFLDIALPGLPALEVLVMGLGWQLADGSVVPYTFGTAVSLEPYVDQQRQFQRNLIGWFAGITVTMLVVVLGVLGWVLRPVRRLARQVRDVEAGNRTGLTGDYPTELVGLAGNLNALIETERRRLERYRNMLDDLAHSLKTPLAAMRTLLAEGDDGRLPKDRLDRELDRMDQRVSYQLRRARASGATGLGVEPTAVAPLVDDLKLTLDKVYHDKHVECTVAVGDHVTFRGDPGDLLEILGNLLENAYKYCKAQVAVAARNEGARLIITIDDDGPGISEADFRSLIERGTRADESQPGQGIGLAVVRETVELYSGSCSVSRAELGGASIRVVIGRAGLL